MLHSAGKTVIAVALALLLGLQWSILQSAAWVGMIISYSQESTLSEAIVKTFDGQHPCRLCKIIEQGKRSEKTRQMANPTQKLEATASEPFLSLFHPESQEPGSAPLPPREALTFPPPHLPPRA